MLSEKDLNLLYELDSNYRSSLVKLSKATGLSEQLILYKTRVFRKNGLIKGVYPLFDYSRFGLATYIVFFNIRHKEHRQEGRVRDSLIKDKNTVEVLECDGMYDLVCIFAARNASRFNTFLQIAVSENPDIRRWTTLTCIEENHYLRDYLVKEKKLEIFKLGGDKETAGLDDTDHNICKAIFDGKIKVIDISRYAKVHPKTVISRIKQLEGDIIKGYRLSLDLTSISITSNLILLNFRNISSIQEEKLKRYCINHPNIIEYNKTLGEWDVIIITETSGRPQFRALELDLRERFDDIIAEMDTFRVFDIHKRQLLPDKIFTQGNT